MLAQIFILKVHRRSSTKYFINSAIFETNFCQDPSIQIIIFGPKCIKILMLGIDWNINMIFERSYDQILPLKCVQTDLIARWFFFIKYRSEERRVGKECSSRWL